MLVMVLTLTLFLAAGCDSGGGESKSTPVPAETATSRCGGSLEGCFGYAEMPVYLDSITPLVSQFFNARYASVREPRIVFVPNGRNGSGPCGGYATSQSYEYCPANQTIYVGQDLLWSFYHGAGDAAPAIGLAHEWGHHLQFMLDVPMPRSAAESVRFENQADCISGAWAKYAREKGWLEEPDDIEDAGALLQAIGSRESAGRDHGTAVERTKSFQMSFREGIKACDAFFPTAPIG